MSTPPPPAATLQACHGGTSPGSSPHQRCQVLAGVSRGRAGGGQGRLPRPGSDTPSFRALCGAGHAREPEPPGKEETLFAGISHLTIGSSF